MPLCAGESRYKKPEIRNRRSTRCRGGQKQNRKNRLVFERMPNENHRRKVSSGDKINTRPKKGWPYDRKTHPSVFLYFYKIAPAERTAKGKTKVRLIRIWVRPSAISAYCPPQKHKCIGLSICRIYSLRNVTTCCLWKRIYHIYLFWRNIIGDFACHIVKEKLEKGRKWRI